MVSVCYHDRVADDRGLIHVRATAELKQRVAALAAELHISINAAATVLLDEALRARGR